MFPYKIAQNTLIISLVFILAACASKPQLSLKQPDSEISGKLAVREANRNTTMLFRWLQKKDQHIIYLMSILGQTQLTLFGDAHRAGALDTTGHTYYADSPEELLFAFTGWHFPLLQAKQWLQGQTTANISEINYDETGQVSSFISPPWHIQFSQYRLHNEHLQPHKIQIKHQEESLTLTFIIKKYAP